MVEPTPPYDPPFRETGDDAALEPPDWYTDPDYVEPEEVPGSAPPPAGGG